jgi:integrating conjugative element protein (TIGR03756 family)
MKRYFYFLFYLFLIHLIFFNSWIAEAGAKVKPATSITSFIIAQTIATHYLDYTHYKIIGSCFWKECSWGMCHFPVTLELDEYLPDLVVTVSPHADSNPWVEARDLLDRPGHFIGSQLIEGTTGFSLDNGNTSGLIHVAHYDSLRTKSVDVIGNPFTLLHFPFLNLKVDTVPYLPYYQSDLDVLGRLGIAEMMRMETWNPLGNPIGRGAFNHWSYEFPRSMSVNVDNNYKASLVAALRATDIVTNQNTLHTVQSTSNSCGIHCSVSNVIEEQTEQHAIWQEVYPYDRHIHIGEDDHLNIQSLGAEDENAGQGNYVFVVWRHYRGCVEADKTATLLMAIVTISPTQKR